MSHHICEINALYKCKLDNTFYMNATNNLQMNCVKQLGIKSQIV